MSFDFKNVVIIGASGAIGSALSRYYASRGCSVYALSRRSVDFSDPRIRIHQIDFSNEKSIEKASDIVFERCEPDLIVIATGVLCCEGVMPEKSLKDISVAYMKEIFQVNTVAPALVMKYFLPRMSRAKPYCFAALSARVGSISDNRLGGWYGYRASKSALNMLIKTASIEVARRNKEAVVVGLHPGTVKSDLSEPFQSNVPEGELFSPDDSARYLGGVIDGLSSEDSGCVFAWDGEIIEY